MLLDSCAARLHGRHSFELNLQRTSLIGRGEPRPSAIRPETLWVLIRTSTAAGTDACPRKPRAMDPT